MIRRKFVRPDQLIDTPAGQLPCISDGAMQNAMIDVAAVLCMNGGHIQVVTERVPTGVVEHESVTVMAVIEWTNHTQAKAQPEEHAPIATPPAPQAAPAAPPPAPMVPAAFAAPADAGQQVAAAMAAAAQQAPAAPAPPVTVAAPGLPELPPSAQYAMAAPLPPGEGDGWQDGEDTSSIDGPQG